MDRHWIFIGAILGAVAIGTGTWGAHGLDKFLQQKHQLGSAVESSGTAPSDASVDYDEYLVNRRAGNWATAVNYQMNHVLGMIAVGIIGLFRKSKWLTIAGSCFLAGILLFSGSLYALVVTEIRVLGAITPLGGISFIIGWLALARGGCCLTSQQAEKSLTELE